MRNFAKIIVLLLIFGLVAIPVTAEKPVTSPNLEEAIKFELGIDSQTKMKITEEHLEDLTRLEASWWEIDNLKGLEHATNLSELYLEGNQIADISLLRSLSNIKYLTLTDNQISNISPLQEYRNISLLDLSQNKISDLSPLKNITFSGEKIGLNLAENQISNISPLTSISVPSGKEYFYVDLSNNEITSLNGLKNMKGITELKANDNQISNVDSLASLKDLRYLAMANNNISKVPNLSTTQLQTVILNTNQLTNVDFLKNSKPLYIDLSKNNIEDISGLEHITQGYINLSNNNISDISLLRNFEKGTIILNGNPLSKASSDIIKELLSKDNVNVSFDENDINTDEHRIYGKDRYNTAIAISQKGWADNSTDTVIIARGDSFPDALAGAPLANAFNAPVLLTGKTLTNETIKEIKRVGAENAIILGGTSAVSDDVVNQLKKHGLENIIRVNGSGRFDTATKTAEMLINHNGKADTAIIAFGHDFPDALAIAPYAAQNGYPILLTNKKEIPEATKAFLQNEENGIENIIIVGGEKVIDPAVEEELGVNFTVTRISGASRYHTAAEIITKTGQSPSKVYIANGNSFADALTGSVLAAKEEAALLLVDKNSVPSATTNILKKYNIHEFHVLGGPSIITNSVVLKLSALLK